MSQKEEFQIIYDGPALQDNEMDVRDLAPALLAVGDLLEETNKIVYGELATVNVNVKGTFKTGCFQVDFSLAQSLAKQVSSLLTSQDGVVAVQLLSILGFNAMNGFGLLPFIKWVRSRTIKKVTKLGDGKSSVEIDDEAREVEDAVLELYRNLRVRKSMETIVYNPLQREGVNEFAVKYKEHIEEVKDGEKEYFKSPEISDEVIDDSTSESVLQAVTISFAEGNKWKFSDGNVQFYANILDETFIAKVQANMAAFAKDDILRVKLHKHSYISNGILKTDYEVIEVLKHESIGRQIPLPYGTKEDEKEKTD